LIKLISHEINSHGFNTPKVLDTTFQSPKAAPCCLQRRTFIAPQAQEMGTKQEERVNMSMVLPRQIGSEMVEQEA